MIHRARRIAMSIGLGALALLSQAACGPCFGTLPECTAEPRLAVQGRIVDAESGVSVGGTQVSMVVIAGGASARDSVSIETDSHGFFQLSAAVPTRGPILFDIVVTSSQSKYRVPGLLRNSTRVRGEGHDLGVWVERPYFAIRGEVVRRCAETIPLTNVAVKFRRLFGGGAVEGLDAAGTFTSTTDGNGQFEFLGRAQAASTDTVHGVVEVVQNGERLAAGVSIVPNYMFRAPAFLLQIPVAPASTYVGCIYDRGPVIPAAAIAVDFTRTGGVPTLVTSYSTTTDVNGAFVLRLQPQAEGSVVGDLTIHSVAPSRPYTLHGVTLASVADPLSRKVPLFGVGLHLPYFGRFHRDSVPVSGVKFSVKRVGGIVATPDSISGVTDGTGWLVLHAFKPKEEGELVIDVTVTPPPPATRFIMRGIRLPTQDVDMDGRLVLDVDLNKQNGEPLSADGSRIIRTRRP